MKSKKVVVLDRDGVINLDSEDYIKNVHEWEPIPNSIEAIAKLSQAGYKIIIATNQSGLGRGLFSIKNLDEIHQQLQKKVQEAGGHIDAIFFCPHVPTDNCCCRKPQPGLFQLIETFFHISLAQVPAIGDAKRDIETSLKAHCRPILVRTGKGEQTIMSEDLNAEIVCKDLYEAAVKLISSE
jgi:D-glycero-D-manno-heptose 1,7-bisphosphate phosphatase